MARHQQPQQLRKPTGAALAEDVLAGRRPLALVPQQWCGMVERLLVRPVYDLAVEVLALRGPEARRHRLAQLPDSIRPLVEVEARRLHEYRRSKYRG